MKAVSLGGPGPGCSLSRVRRLVAGELTGPQREELEAHLGGCARCQAARDEIAAEQRAVEAALPFPALASGVAEKLAAAAPARTGEVVPLRRRAGRLARSLPLALAASLALGVALPLVLRTVREREVASETRLKGGGAALTIFVEDGHGARALAPGAAVPTAARLRAAIAPGARRHAALALVDEDGPALIWAGAAAAGPLPGAFEWTGGRRGTLVAVFADAPVDGRALLERLHRGLDAAAPPGTPADVVTFPLSRAGAEAR